MSDQYGRKASLLVTRPETIGNSASAFAAGATLDLSQLHFTFKTVQQDAESPNNCEIRVFNLSPATREQILTQEYNRVILQAGYQNGGFGVVFDGTIKQFRRGKAGALDSYLDLLAADGDRFYNFSVVNKTLAAGSTPAQRVQAALDALRGPGAVTAGYLMPFTGGVLPRGKVLFAHSRTVLRSEAVTQKASWSIQNGQVNFIPLNGYKPGEAVVLNALTGLIGRPEQTNEGLRCRCLLNPRIEIGGLVKIDNASVNQTLAASNNPFNLAYNRIGPGAVQNLATVTADGLYRVYVVEHTGDTRGQDWYTDLICLAVQPDTKKVLPYG